MSNFESPPDHYMICGMQADDIITVVLERWAQRWYEEGRSYEEVAVASAYMFNVLKYALRAASKDGLKDAGKMLDYLNSFIEVLE